jgi:hypothetical protein
MRFHLFYFFLLSSTSLFSQKTTHQIQFDIGISRRTGVISLQNKFGTRGKGVEFDALKHFNNYNLSLDVSKTLFREKFILQLSNYIRYGHNHYERNDDLYSKREVKRFKTDHFLDIVYNWKKNHWKNFSFLVGAGYGVMNVNTLYRFNQVIAIDSSGNPYKVPVIGWFEFNAPRLLLGVETGPSKGILLFTALPMKTMSPMRAYGPK